jgi:hypothetical protein
MARGTRSRTKKDTADTTTTQVDDRTTAVDQAAAATRAADAPEPASSVTDAVAAGTVTEIGTTQELDARFDGQDLELSEEQQAEVIPAPEEDEGLAGVPSLDQLKNRTLGEDLLGADGDPNAPSDDPRENLEAAQAFNPFGTKGDDAGTTAGGGGGTTDTGGGNPFETVGGGGGRNADAGTSPGSGGLGGDARDTGVFDLLQDPGTDGDPLSSFLGAVEAKTGRDLGPAPSDQTNDSVTGVPSVEHDEEGSHIDDFFDASTPVGAAVQGLRSLSAAFPVAQPFVVVSDAVARLAQAKEELDNSGSTQGAPSTKDPGPDGEGAPLPEIFQNQLESEVARLRALKPETGDGVTDPTDSDVEVIDPSAGLQTHAEHGRELFGQPDETAPSGSDANFNPGADSSGAGVITPSEDKDVTPGPTRNDDPFADAGTAAEAVTSSNAAPTDVESFLPSETTGTAIDDTPDVPDPINDPA